MVVRFFMLSYVRSALFPHYQLKISTFSDRIECTKTDTIYNIVILLQHIVYEIQDCGRNTHETESTCKD